MHQAPAALVVVSVNADVALESENMDPLRHADVVVVFGPDGGRVADQAHEMNARFGCRTAGFVTSEIGGGGAELLAFCLEQFGVGPVEVIGR